MSEYIYKKKQVKFIMAQYYALKEQTEINDSLIAVWDFDMALKRLDDEERTLAVMLLQGEKIEVIANRLQMKSKHVYYQKALLAKKIRNLMNNY